MEPFSDDPWRVSWDALDARAWAYLNRHGQVPASVRRGLPFHGYPRLRLWDDAEGFGCEAEPTTLTVFELFTTTHEREPVVREVLWQRSADLGRVRAAIGRAGTGALLAPTVSERYASVPGERLESFLREASAFQIPVAWFSDTESVTSDVGSVGFEFFSRDQPPAVLRIAWAWDTPAAWRPVIEWSQRLRRFLEGCFAGLENSADPGSG